MRSPKGIIPACAGNTFRPGICCLSHRDHPRMCGEHRRLFCWASLQLGSSPHVRGTLDDRGHDREQTGIIPACAGNTCARSAAMRRTWDHPRMCGEHQSTDPLALAQQGSSPHVRGTLHHAGIDGHRAGIIPACAGNTRMTALPRPSTRDHPRMCGEHPLVFCGSLPVRGSSPHVRGTLTLLPPVRACCRIIPACAGNTQPSPFSHVEAWDHPRMCGEHLPS